VIEQRNEWLLDISSTVVEQFQDDPSNEYLSERLEYFLIALAVSNMEVDDARQNPNI
jgi:hypothetical protein